MCHRLKTDANWRPNSTTLYSTDVRDAWTGSLERTAHAIAYLSALLLDRQNDNISFVKNMP